MIHNFTWVHRAPTQLHAHNRLVSAKEFSPPFFLAMNNQKTMTTFRTHERHIIIAKYTDMPHSRQIKLQTVEQHQRVSVDMLCCPTCVARFRTHNYHTGITDSWNCDQNYRTRSTVFYYVLEEKSIGTIWYIFFFLLCSGQSVCFPLTHFPPGIYKLPTRSNFPRVGKYCYVSQAMN